MALTIKHRLTAEKGEVMKTLDENQQEIKENAPLPPYVKEIKNEVDLMRYYFDILRAEVKSKFTTVWVVLIPVCIAIGFLLAKVL